MWGGVVGGAPGPRDRSPSKSSGFSSEYGAEPSRVWSSCLMLSPGLLLGGGSWEGAGRPGPRNLCTSLPHLTRVLVPAA